MKGSRECVDLEEVMRDHGPGRQASEHSVQILIPLIASVGPNLPSLLPFFQGASSSKGLLWFLCPMYSESQRTSANG